MSHLSYKNLATFDFPRKNLLSLVVTFSFNFNFAFLITVLVFYFRSYLLGS